MKIILNIVIIGFAVLAVFGLISFVAALILGHFNSTFNAIVFFCSVVLNPALLAVVFKIVLDLINMTTTNKT